MKVEEKPIRVLCVFSSLDRGGAETMCMNIYRNIDRSLVQFDFVKHTLDKCAFDDEIRSLGGKIYIAPRFKGYNLIQYQDWWKKHLLDHPEHKIVHGHYFTASKYYFSICRKMGRITIGHSHTDHYTRILKKVMMRGAENYCDYRFACSEKAGKLLYPHKDFMVINNAIDVKKHTFNPKVREEIRKEFNLSESVIVIGTVGTIKEVKNPIGIVEIMHAIYRKNRNVKLLWVGRDGGMQNLVKSKLAEYGLTDIVLFTGSRSDVHRLLQGMDYFILPSFSEGLPLSVMEAQAAALPCYISDVVTHDVDITGLCHFIPINMTEIWAEKILHDHTQRYDTSEMIKKAGYDINTTAKWMQEFYLKISN